MPARIATLGRERTVAALARRLYTIDGRTKAEKQRRAEAALIRANPRLAGADGFRSGGRIVVPGISGLERSAEVSVAEPSGAGLTSETALRLQALASRLEDSFGRDREKRKQTMARIDDPQLNAEARKALRESVDFIEKTRERLRQSEEQAGAVQERLSTAVTAALEGVEAIEKLFSKSSPR